MKRPNSLSIGSSLSTPLTIVSTAKRIDAWQKIQKYFETCPPEVTDAWLVVVSPPIAVEPPAATTGVGHTVVASAAIAVDPPVADTTTSDASTPIASLRPRPIYDLIVVEPFPRTRIPLPLVRPSPPLTAPLARHKRIATFAGYPLIHERPLISEGYVKVL